ncbi:MAG: glycosyltransferase [Anaerolineae bacterium]|nr:glycosyltransferase [Anaerolineae bacterium]
MSRVFEEIGYQVHRVIGNRPERMLAIEHVKREVLQGHTYDFVYAESTSGPSLLVNRELYHPFRDFGFLRWCRLHSIPVGLYYRDVHWRFGIIRPDAPWYKEIHPLILFWYDWFCYYLALDHLFIQSMGMAKYLPTKWPATRASSLPPGCDLAPLDDSDCKRPADDNLRLLYIGGVRPPIYDLKPMFEFVTKHPMLHLTVCCRDFEWAKIQSYYEPFDRNKIRIIHAFGDQLPALYESTHVFLLLLNPHTYWDFVMPVKLFEAIGFGKPLITTAGTQVARFVEEEGLGWTVSSSDEFGNLILYLQANPDLVLEKCRHVERVREQHTWQVRAQTVADVLGSYRKK